MKENEYQLIQSAFKVAKNQSGAQNPNMTNEGVVGKKHNIQRINLSSTTRPRTANSKNGFASGGPQTVIA